MEQVREPSFNENLPARQLAHAEAEFAPTMVDAVPLAQEVQVTVPLYQGGMLDSKVRQAVAQEQESQERLAESEQRLQNEFRKSFLSVQEQLARVQALNTAMASAQLSVKANQRSVLAGARSPLDVLIAEQKLAQAGMQMSDARNQAILAWVKTMTWAEADHEGVLRKLSSWLLP